MLLPPLWPHSIPMDTTQDSGIAGQIWMADKIGSVKVLQSQCRRTGVEGRRMPTLIFQLDNWGRVDY